MHHIPPITMISALNRPTLRSEIVSSLIDSIFAGKLAMDTRLQERELAKQLGVSRTPLREALLELDFLGIVSIQNYRGAIIRRFGEDDLRDIYFIRSLLEAEATNAACPKLSSADINA